MYLIIDGKIYESERYGGIARIFDNILPLMCDMDTNLRIILFFTKQPKIPFPTHKGISIIFLDNIHKFIVQFLKPWKIWHTHYNDIQDKYFRFRMGKTKEKIWFSTYYTRPPSWWLGREIVLTHDFIYELYPELMPDSKTFIMQKEKSIMVADKVFCNSWTTAKDLQKYYPVPDRKIVVNHLSKDKLFTIRKEGVIETSLSFKFILYVGTRWNYKGFDTLLEAYSIWKGRQDIKLVVVGSKWTMDELEDIKARGIEHQVVLMENIGDDLLCDLYNHAQCLIYPSIYEGFGIPLLEAMACGCPVIASRIPSTLEVAGEVPIYFESGNSKSLCNALETLEIDNDHDLQNRIEQGFQKASEYNWEKTAQTFLTELKKLNEES